MKGHINDNEEEGIISTSPPINKQNDLIKNNLNEMPLSCLSKILSFLSYGLDSISYRRVSKKFDEAVRIFLFINILSQKNAELFKKMFIFLNQNCHNYFYENVYPYLIDADSLYEFLSVRNETVFKNFFSFSENEIKKTKESSGLLLKEKNFSNSLKRTINKFLSKIIVINLEKEMIEELDFDQLEPYENSIEIILYLLEYMSKLKYLDLSKLIFQDEKIIEKILQKISLIQREFTLKLQGIYLSTPILKIIKEITDKNDKIKIIIDNQFKGKMNSLGGRKLNNKIQNKKKIKYKNHHRRNDDEIQ